MIYFHVSQNSIAVGDTLKAWHNLQNNLEMIGLFTEKRSIQFRVLEFFVKMYL